MEQIIKVINGKRYEIKIIWQENTEYDGSLKGVVHIPLELKPKTIPMLYIIPAVSPTKGFVLQLKVQYSYTFSKDQTYSLISETSDLSLDGVTELQTRGLYFIISHLNDNED